MNGRFSGTKVHRFEHSFQQTVYDKDQCYSLRGLELLARGITFDEIIRQYHSDIANQDIGAGTKGPTALVQEEEINMV